MSWCYPKGTAFPLPAANSSYDKRRFCCTHDPNRDRTFIKFVSIVAHRRAPIPELNLALTADPLPTFRVLHKSPYNFLGMAIKYLSRLDNSPQRTAAKERCKLGWYNGANIDGMLFSAAKFVYSVIHSHYV